MTARYCPLCGAKLSQRRNSRFADCPEHGKLNVRVTRVHES